MLTQCCVLMQAANSALTTLAPSTGAACKAVLLSRQQDAHTVLCADAGSKLGNHDPRTKHRCCMQGSPAEQAIRRSHSAVW